MLVLGVFTLIEVSFIVGVALILVAGAMYAFNWWVRGKIQRSIEEGDRSSPSS